MSEIDPRDAAMDASAITFQLLSFTNGWTFTEGAKDDLKRNLDGLREILTQMGFHKSWTEKKTGHDSSEWYFYLQRVAIGAMIMYLSGALDTVQCDE